MLAGLRKLPKFADAQFIVPDWGDKVDYDIGLHRRADTTTICHSRLYPPIKDYEFGYRMGL